MEINRLPKRSAALAALEGFRHLTPIQEQVIPLALKGRDIIGISDTGTRWRGNCRVPLDAVCTLIFKIGEQSGEFRLF